MNRLWLKLIYKCFMVTLPFWILWIHIWTNPLSYYGAFDNANFLWNKKNINTTQKQEYNTLILGDSLANSAFVPEYLSEDTLNLALSTSTPFNTYYILKTYLKHNKPPKVCYIMFADHHMYRINGFYERTLYTHHLSFLQEMELFYNAKRYHEKSVLKKDWFNNWLSYRFRLPNQYINSIMNSGFNQNYIKNKTIYDLAEMHRGTYISRTTRESKYNKKDVWNKYKVKPFYNLYYKKILDLCKKENIKVHIVILPKGPWMQVNDSYWQSMREYYNSLMQKYPNVTYIDEFEGFERCHFSDVRHMNMKGALKFSQEIKKRYPQDFNNSLKISPKTIKGMEDYISLENTPANIIRRIAGYNFSVVLIFKSNRGGKDNELVDVLNEYYNVNTNLFSFLYGKNLSKDQILYVNGLNRNVSLLQYDEMSDNIKIKNDGKKIYIDILKWNNKPFEYKISKLNGDMDLIVLNNYDKKILFVKDFSYPKTQYEVVQVSK